MPTIEGTVERITYRNSENNYCVLRLDARGAEGKVTVIGHLPELSPGEMLTLEGEWVVHHTYGRQFKAANFSVIQPATLHGIEKYLASGAVKGIGPVTAQAIVKKFGLEALDVMENNPERLQELEGIGPKKAEKIIKSYANQKEIRNVMVFLQSHGVSPAYAGRIYRHYGDASIEKVIEDPYSLADDVFGIGFRTADRVAQTLNIAKDSPRRMQAGLRYCLGQLADNGHCFYPRQGLVESAAKMLETEFEPVEDAIPLLAKQGHIVIEKSLEEADRDMIYLAPFFHAEQGVARLLAGLIKGQRSLINCDADADIAALEKDFATTYAALQQKALTRAMSAGVMVITGGPGTGKTTTLNGLIRLYEMRGLKVALAAPTGRAAKRLAETSSREAKTIHRLLEYAYEDGVGLRFGRNEQNPIECNVLIVDETSMVDIILMYALLKAIAPGTRLILVGDRNQLPSVGPGSVLADVIASQAVETVELTEIFRQSAQSNIVTNAHLINQGEYPHHQGPDFQHIPMESLEDILDTIVKLASDGLRRRAGYNPFTDIQVLTPMRKTLVGVENLNAILQSKLNPPREGAPELRWGPLVFRPGDKVMQIRNNYQKNVYNGDIGYIQEIDLQEKALSIVFPDREGGNIVFYEFDEIIDLTLAYATSVHKSQGSEYPVVVMPICTAHYMLLKRNLLYTGVTRAKKVVILVGQKKAIAMAVNNDKEGKRCTLLAQRLRQHVLPEA